MNSYSNKTKPIANDLADKIDSVTIRIKAVVNSPSNVANVAMKNIHNVYPKGI